MPWDLLEVCSFLCGTAQGLGHTRLSLWPGTWQLEVGWAWHPCPLLAACLHSLAALPPAVAAPPTAPQGAPGFASQLLHWTITASRLQEAMPGTGISHACGLCVRPFGGSFTLRSGTWAAMTRRLGSAGPAGQSAQVWPLHAARVPPRLGAGFWKGTAQERVSQNPDRSHLAFLTWPCKAERVPSTGPWPETASPIWFPAGSHRVE